jgi:hypothetical protein
LFNDQCVLMSLKLTCFPETGPLSGAGQIMKVAKRPARSSSIRRIPIFTISSAAVRRCPTASVFAGKGSRGRASNRSRARPSGLIGTRRHQPLFWFVLSLALGLGRGCIGASLVCCCRFWTCLLPKFSGGVQRLDLVVCPPVQLIADLMQLPMMTAAERHGELVTDLHADGAGLGKA